MTLYSKSFSERIELKETFEVKAYKANNKRWFIHHVSGWFESIRKDLSPKGVFKLQVVDRKNNRYRKFVVDALVKVRVIKDIEEKLSDHHK